MSADETDLKERHELKTMTKYVLLLISNKKFKSAL